MKKISLITPVLNEEETLDTFFKEVYAFTNKHSNIYEFEFIFTDNCSTDKTFKKLLNYYKKDPRIKIFRLSKNFGYQRSIWTGYSQATGDACIQLDADLQDPLSIVSIFLKEWEDGKKIVYGIRKNRKEAFLIKNVRKCFYRVLNKLSKDTLPADAGDFMLIDKSIVQLLREEYDPRIYIRGRVHSYGFKKKGVPYSRNERLHGESKFNLGRNFSLALDAIVNHSFVPLRIAILIGFLFFIFSILFSSCYLVAKIFFKTSWPAGFATTTILLLVGIGLNGLFVGAIGEYILRIHSILKKPKMSIIEEKTT